MSCYSLSRSFARSLPAGAAALALCLGVSAWAQAPVSVSDAWVRATVPQQQATGVFMQIKADADARLVGGSTPVANAVEVHEMAMSNGVMKMRELAEGLPLPKGETVSLKPGGYHIMLMGLKQPMNEGEQVPLVLNFRTADGQSLSLPIQAPVRALKQSAHDKAHGGGAAHKH